MNDSKLVTVADCVAWAQSQLQQSEAFFGHGCDNSLDEAIWATLHTAKLPYEEYENVRKLELSRSVRSSLRELIEKRIATRKPLAYLIREAWFAGLKFYIDERAIVPRSHFGDLIQDGFGPWVRPNEIERVLDLCTGSACMAIALALKYPQAEIHASDIDERALEVARVNVERHNCARRVKLVQSDLFDKLAGNRYDLIVCNPPYVEESAIDGLPKEYRHEPRHALAAGEGGIGTVRKILSQSVPYLKDRGTLLIELGNSAAVLERAFPRIPFLWLTSRSGESVVLSIGARELQSYRSTFEKPSNR